MDFFARGQDRILECGEDHSDPNAIKNRHCRSHESHVACNNGRRIRQEKAELSVYLLWGAIPPATNVN